MELLKKAQTRTSIFDAYVTNAVEFLKRMRPDIGEDKLTEFIKELLIQKNSAMIERLKQAKINGEDLNAKRKPEERLWPTINGIRSSDPDNPSSKAHKYGEECELKDYDLSRWIFDYRNKIISPFGSTYQTADINPSFLKGMVDMKKVERKQEKKLMLKAKKEGNKAAEVFHNNQQATIKINMNSYIGAMGSGFSNLSSVANYNSVTSISRFFIMYSYAHAERFLESNFYFRTEEQLINFITSCIVLGPSDERIHKVMNKCKVNYPDVEEVVDFLVSSLQRYDNLHPCDNAVKLIRSCSRERLSFLYYMSNMKHIVERNNTFFREWINKLFNDQVPMFECKPEDINKLDGDLVIVLSTVYNSLLPANPKSGNNISVYDCIDQAPEIAKRLYCLGCHMQSCMDEIQDVFDLFTDHEVAIGYVSEHRNQYRDAVVVSDTDSIIFTTKSWVEWYTNGLKLDNTAFNINALVVYWLSKANANILFHVSKNLGALDKDLLTMAMKNEFMMPIEILTSLKKHYMSILKIQEGVFYKNPRMDIKGVNLRGSNFSASVLNYVTWFITSLIQDIYENGEVDPEKKIVEVLRFEKMVHDSLMRGETTFLSVDPVKNKSEYADPDKSIYFNYLFWEAVFAEKYGHIDIPTKCYVVPLNNARDTHFIESLKSVDEKIGTAWEKFVKSTKKDITRIVLNPIVNTIPQEIRFNCNYRSIVYLNTKPLYLVMSTLGINAGNNIKKIVLFSDIYGSVSSEEGAKALEHTV